MRIDILAMMAALEVGQWMACEIYVPAPAAPPSSIPSVNRRIKAFTYPARPIAPNQRMAPPAVPDTPKRADPPCLGPFR